MSCRFGYESSLCIRLSTHTHTSAYRQDTILSWRGRKTSRQDKKQLFDGGRSRQKRIEIQIDLQTICNNSIKKLYTQIHRATVEQTKGRRMRRMTDGRTDSGHSGGAEGVHQITHSLGGLLFPSTERTGLDQTRPIKTTSRLFAPYVSVSVSVPRYLYLAVPFVYPSV